MEEKYAYRFPPCPAWDVEGLESWLEDLAQDGLVLDKDPFFAGFATFRKTQPQKVRYRLQPKAKKDADPRALELAEAYGWTYLGDHWSFSIFMTADAAARELDTDPQVQAMAIHGLYKRERWNLWWNLLLDAVVLGVIVWGAPLLFLLEQPSWYLWLLVTIWVLYFAQTASELRCFKGLKNRLAMGEPLSRSRDWRKNRWRHWFGSAFAVVLLVVFFWAVIFGRMIDWEDKRWTDTWSTSLATLEDLGTFVPQEHSYITEYDHMAMRTGLLVREQAKISQYGALDGEDIYLQMEYWSMSTEWLAKELFRELWQRQEVSRPALPVDDAVLYYDHGGILVLREGDTVLQVKLVQMGTDLPEETWIRVFAEGLVDA